MTDRIAAMSPVTKLARGGDGLTNGVACSEQIRVATASQRKQMFDDSQDPCDECLRRGGRRRTGLKTALGLGDELAVPRHRCGCGRGSDDGTANSGSPVRVLGNKKGEVIKPEDSHHQYRGVAVQRGAPQNRRFAPLQEDRERRGDDLEVAQRNSYNAARKFLHRSRRALR